MQKLDGHWEMSEELKATLLPLLPSFAPLLASLTSLIHQRIKSTNNNNSNNNDVISLDWVGSAALSVLMMTILQTSRKATACTMIISKTKAWLSRLSLPPSSPLFDLALIDSMMLYAKHKLPETFCIDV